MMAVAKTTDAAKKHGMCIILYKGEYHGLQQTKVLTQGAALPPLYPL